MEQDRRATSAANPDADPRHGERQSREWRKGLRRLTAPQILILPIIHGTKYAFQPALQILMLPSLPRQLLALF